MKKNGKKNFFVGITVVMVALCLLAYVMVYSKYTEMTDKLKVSNNELAVQVEEMKGYYVKMDQYKVDTEKMVAGIEELTMEYSSQANEEDFIMTGVNMQLNSIINFEKVNIETEEVIHSIPVETVVGAGIEKYQQPIEFYARKASYENLTDYANLKNALQVVFDIPYKVGINNITYARENESNNFMEGAIDITYYTVQGMDKEYEYPKMDGYLAGVQDLFGKMFTEEGESNSKKDND
ncbi:MAG: hypothetical protein E7292_05130 [Lachnospiraceae bacterium]|nr:hypothetical protein [Lachnospiraceae bacterium]